MNYVQTILIQFISFFAKLLWPLGLQRIPVVRKSYSFVLRVLKLQSVTISGRKIYLDRNDSLRLSIWKHHEPFLTTLFTKSIHKNDTVLDIGAHIGYYTLIAAGQVGEKGNVFAFEPHPGFFNLLAKNIRSNSLHNVIPVNKAVLDKESKAPLSLGEGNSDANFEIHEHASHKNAFSVRTVSLDQYFGKRKRTVHVIKMDTEGSELRILKGMEKLLTLQQSMILFSEFWPRGLIRMGGSGQEFLNLLKKLTFQIYEIDEDTENILLIKPSLFADLCSEYTAENGRHTNLLCIKGPISAHLSVQLILP